MARKVKNSQSRHKLVSEKPDIFTKFTTSVALLIGKPAVFIAALLLLSIWAICGPLLGFSDTWQLIINTSTTIVTFLTVFIIQNTQNRDNLAINLKIDALLKKQGITDKDLLDAEDETEQILQKEKAKLQGSKR